jgi:hypothetical protein
MAFTVAKNGKEWVERVCARELRVDGFLLVGQERVTGGFTRRDLCFG